MLNRLAQRAEQAEVYEVESETTSISLEGNRVNSYEVKENRGRAARVVMDNRLGFSSSSDLEASDQLFDNVLESARHGDVVPLRFPAPQSGPCPRVYDQRVATLAIDGLVGIGQEMIATILDAEPDAQVQVDLQRLIGRANLNNTAGAHTKIEKTSLSASIVVQQISEGDIALIGGDFNSAIIDDGHLVLARAVVDKLRLAQNTAGIRSGRMPVLFAPTGALLLAFHMMVGLNGKNVHQGISPLNGRLREPVFDEKLTVVDDPTLDGRPFSSSHDGEGCPRRHQTLVEKGTLCSFIYDLKSAAQAHVEPTGHGHRSALDPPYCSFSNLIVESGNTPLTEMIAGINEGLLVEMALGIGQANSMNGDFSNPLALAFKIERGEIVGRVKGCAIAGNLYQDLRHIGAVSQEAEWVRYCIRLPYILLPEINVVSTQPS